MSKLALQVSPAGEVVELDMTIDGLTVLQGAVDGLIQPIDFHGMTMWVNEEGLLRNDLKENVIAQLFYAGAIMGTVVFTGGTDNVGNTLPLDHENAARIKNLSEIFAKAINDVKEWGTEL